MTMDAFTSQSDEPLRLEQPTSPHHYLGYVARAVRRNLVAAAVSFVAVLALTAEYYKKSPRVYRLEARLLAQAQSAIPGLGRQGSMESAPTRTAWEVIHSRDNLLAVIQQADLKTKERPRDGGRRSGTDGDGQLLAQDEKLNALVETLARSLLVTTGDGTVTIALEWRDPGEGYRIVQATVQNFLESRQIQEITSVDELINSVEGEASALGHELEMEESRLRMMMRPARGSLRGALPSSKRRRTAGEDQLRLTIESKQRIIKDIEELRRRRLVELQSQYEEKRGIYSEQYPTVVALRQDISALSEPSPQVLALKRELQSLEAELKQRYQSGPPDAEAGATPAMEGYPSEESAAMAEQQERVRDLRLKYSRVAERVTNLRFEQAATRAGFKYRYAVVSPATIPRRAIRPVRNKVLGAGGVAAVAFSLVVATLLQLARGRIEQKWQVERRLKIPVFEI